MVRLLPCLLLLCGLAEGSERFERYSGDALDLRESFKLYEEEHWLHFKHDHLIERRVLYRCPSGQAFARKRVDYRDSLHAPAFELVDARFGYREGLRRAATGIEAYFRSSHEAEEQSVILSEAGSLVADAGFDRFVQQHWETLGGGGAVALEFLVPSRGDALGFRMQLAGQREIDGIEARVVRLSLGGVLGWFASSIDVAYAEDDRRLLRFEGLSNIRLDPKRNATVRINFPKPPEPVATEQWREVLNQPLETCQLGS